MESSQNIGVKTTNQISINSTLKSKTNNNMCLAPEFTITYEERNTMNRIVNEYLLSQQYHMTLNYFNDEINRIKKYQKIDEFTYEQNFIQAFDDGKKIDFFQLWDKFIPITNRNSPYVDKTKVIELKLQIYFTIYNIHPVIQKKCQELKPIIDRKEFARFQNYLKEFAMEFIEKAEYQNLYTLKGDKNLEQNSVWKLFQGEDWIFDLRNELQIYIRKQYTSYRHFTPLLYDQMVQYATPGQKDAQSMAIKNQKLQSELNFQLSCLDQISINNSEFCQNLIQTKSHFATLKEKYQDITNHGKNIMQEFKMKQQLNMKDMISIIREMLKIIDSQNQGQKTDEKIIQQLVERTNKYDDILQDVDQNLNKELVNFDTYSQSIVKSIDQAQEDINIQVEQMEKKNNEMLEKQKLRKEDIFPDKEELKKEKMLSGIDFHKISQVFEKNDDENLICNILQALRWRITNTKKALKRREIIISYTTDDILGCLPSTDSNIYENLLVTGSDRVKEFSVALINALASDYYGRSYLVITGRVLYSLIDLLLAQTMEAHDSSLVKNIIGALQKLSLRKKSQIVMIEKDIIQWIVDQLNKDQKLFSEYFLEYIMALLMNLTLLKDGRLKCDPLKVQLLDALKNLLSNDNEQVRTFCNGTLYQILAKQSIRHKAKQSELQLHIEKIIKENDDKQLIYVIKQLNSTKSEDEIFKEQEEDNDIDDIEEQSEIFDELEMKQTGEAFFKAQGQKIGEDLLEQYALSDKEALLQMQVIQQIMAKTNEQRLINIEAFKYTSRQKYFKQQNV